MSECLKVAVSAADLKEKDPRRFDREYLKWTEWQWQDDWYVEDAQKHFTQMYEPYGIDIESLNYSISYSQGDFASFVGRVDVTKWMETVRVCPDGPTYAERYPAMYLACREDGTYIASKSSDGRRGWGFDWHEYWYNVAPCGIFSGLSEEDWDALLTQQHQESKIEHEIEGYCKSIGEEIYRYLRDSYEAATSEEAFIESCEINEIDFELEDES